MITVDYREGSVGLAPLLRAKGLPVQIGTLHFGDVAFDGNGPEGCPVPVGVEVKTLGDVLKCMTDGRFAGHQLPGMINSYIQPWLLVEGIWRSGKEGLLEQLRGNQWRPATVGSRKFMYRDFLTWKLTLQTKAGMNVQECSSWNEAAVWISTLYNWWTVKEFDQHRSHIAIHTPMERENGLFDRAILTRPTVCRLVAMQLPGVGVEKSREIAAKFRTVEELVMADEADFSTIPGIGKELARRIYGSLRG